MRTKTKKRGFIDRIRRVESAQTSIEEESQGSMVIVSIA